jgi:hypothetical protein
VGHHRVFVQSGEQRDVAVCTRNDGRREHWSEVCAHCAACGAVITPRISVLGALTSVSLGLFIDANGFIVFDDDDNDADNDADLMFKSDIDQHSVATANGVVTTTSASTVTSSAENTAATTTSTSVATTLSTTPTAPKSHSTPSRLEASDSGALVPVHIDTNYAHTGIVMASDGDYNADDDDDDDDDGLLFRHGLTQRRFAPRAPPGERRRCASRHAIELCLRDDSCCAGGTCSRSRLAHGGAIADRQRT